MAGPDPDKPAGEDFSKSLKELEKESKELKSKIDEDRRAHDLPINSQLGDPKWEKAEPKTGASTAPRTKTRNRAGLGKIFQQFLPGNQNRE